MKLYPFQEDGVDFLADRTDSYLADSMGLGKTIQVIRTLDRWYKEGVYDKEAVYTFDSRKRLDPKILIVCPASLKANWLKELNIWLESPLTAGIADAKNWPDTSIVIASYGILGKELPFTESHSFTWNALILDECQFMKNPKAKRTKAIIGARGMQAIKSHRKIAISGTPIVNRPIEAFNVLNYLQPRAWGTRHRFAINYCAAWKAPWGWDYSGAKNLAHFNSKLQSLMIRRHKSDVLKELPPKVRQIIQLDLATNKTFSFTDGVGTITSDEGYKLAIQDLQAGEPDDFSRISQVRRETALAKVPASIQLIQQGIESSGKVVVFCHHRDVADAIGDHFPNHVKVTGSTPVKLRQPLVEAFQTDPYLNLFIGSIKAAGVGITLTAASHIIFIELDWVPGDMLQAEDRCHRIGQDAESLLIQMLVVNNSLESYMAQALVKKMEVIQEAID